MPQQHQSVGTMLSPMPLPTTVTATAAASATIGLIFPPSDVRGIIDKTAQFVAKNGPEFEQRVLADQSNTHKFNFLLASNPYRVYYDAKVLEYQTGEVNEATQQHIPEAIKERRRREAEKKQRKDELLALTAYASDHPSLLARAAGQDSASVDSQTVLALEDEAHRILERPPEDQYTVAPPYAAALDIHVIKLTAQYVARNGQKFLVGLGQRERGNPQFAFLKATHPLFSYFTLLVDAYSKCLLPDKATVSRLKDDVGIAGKFIDSQETDAQPLTKPMMAPLTALTADGLVELPKPRYRALFNILHRVFERQRWEAFEEKQKEEKDKHDADERESMQAMDWHEFTVVEVIEFREEDERLPLGKPIDKATLLRPKPIPPLVSSQVSLSAGLASEIRETLGSEGMEALEEGVPMEEDEEQLQPQQQQAVQSNADVVVSREEAEPTVTEPPMASKAPPSSVVTPSTTKVPAVQPLLVVKDYVRQGKKRGMTETSVGLQKCPITGRLVPTEQFTDHLRIVLLDPKWKEEKNAVMEKARKESALASTEDFAPNLAEFVINRPDLFGTVEDEVESAYIPAPKQRKG